MSKQDKPHFETEREKRMWEAGFKAAVQEERAANEDNGDEDGLTLEQVKAMSAEEHIERKAEVDAFLEKQGQS